MRKTSTLLALLLMAAMPLFATHVEPERAQRVAQSFMSNNEKGNVQLQDLSKAAGFSNLYIFTTSKSFVIVAGDDCVQPILGYSLTNSFVVKDMPENVKGWLQGYNDEIQFAVENDAKASSETKQQWQDLENGVKGTKATVVIEPLLHTLWDQGEPYNQLCPTINNEATYSGCVATSMAQIMKYWNWPIKGNSSHSYTWKYKINNHTYSQTLSANFANTTYDWINMTDTYGGNSTEAEETAVATLMYHCGVAVEMDYGTDGSGAYSSDIPNALTSYFRYSSTATYRSKGYNTSNSTWYGYLKEDLNAGRPVQYSGSGTGGGHAFVCDGYDDSNYFHFNWGWSGMYDGYFTVNNLNPGTGGAGSGSSGTYNSSQAIVTGIQPTYAISSAPTLTVTLTQNQTTRNANLSWTSVSNATSYQVFRNRKLIATTSSRTYTDENAPYGNNKYYVRGVNSSNGISQPSTEVTVAFENPTNLVVTLEDGLFDMTWTGTALAHSYKIYCNGYNIGSTENTSISFTLAAYGDLEFYVTAVDFNEDESMPSNIVTVNQQFYGPVVSDLEATPGDASATIEWTGLTANESYGMSHLSDYSEDFYYGVGYSAGLYWAVRFPVSMLSFYHGAAIQSVYTYINEAGTYQVKVYQCTGDAPSGTPIASVSNTYSEAGVQTIDLGGTYYLDATKDLWIVFYTSGVSYPMLFALYDNGEGDYVSLDGTDWFHLGDYSWLINAILTDGSYFYNLYRNGEMIAESLTETNYTDENLPTNAAYKYTVTTNYLGGVSAPSNFSELVFGEATNEGNLTMKRNDNLLVLANGKLTVTGALNNNYASNLVIENGAQLIHNSDNVQATVKTTISGYGKEEGHWHLIASPIVGKHSTEGLVTDNYDLYLYNEPTEYWWNAKGNEGDDHSFNELNHGQGYLYASQNDINTSYVGALKPSNNAMSTELSYTESAPHLKGFNLVGNPFTCNATVNMDFFVMNDAGDDLTLASSNRQIKPMEGIFVKATGAGQSVSFSKGNAKNAHNGTSIDLVVSQSEQPIDRVRVRFGDETGIEKFRLNEDNTMLSLRQHDNDMAVAYSDGENTLPVHFKAAKNGVYSISVEMENVDIDYLHLIDNMTGTDVDLLQNSSYTFESKTSDYASRFKLVFNANASSDSESFAYFNGNSWIVNNEGEATLQVIDMMGRTISSKVIHGMDEIDLNVAGVYVLHLIRGNDVKTQKIVVK